MWGALFIVLPQPTYRGSTKIVELTPEDLDNIQGNNFQVPKIVELEDDEVKDKGKTKEDRYWVIFFYVTWSNVCRNFESTVAKASLKYTTSNIHFGKIDLETSPKLAEDYNISLSPTSLDLPTLILFKNGKENGRLPQKVRDGTDADLDRIKSQTLRSAKVTWDRLGWDRSMESIVSAFKLDTLHKST
ncbi:1020_t:CDS:2 [Acaulospora colombiana]|uniref:1020_t:CDS:1 n=1 Tax=Acaulospora colombiana TaxID=27376 RepID=A0ACA9K855_9GLOM|nr:1020_t:CDS:2 [Acaulospora colombiana]